MGERTRSMIGTMDGVSTFVCILPTLKRRMGITLSFSGGR